MRAPSPPLRGSGGCGRLPAAPLYPPLLNLPLVEQHSVIKKLECKIIYNIQILPKNLQIRQMNLTSCSNLLVPSGPEGWVKAPLLYFYPFDDHLPVLVEGVDLGPDVEVGSEDKDVDDTLHQLSHLILTQPRQFTKYSRLEDIGKFVTFCLIVLLFSKLRMK